MKMDEARFDQARTICHRLEQSIGEGHAYDIVAIAVGMLFAKILVVGRRSSDRPLLFTESMIRNVRSMLKDMERTPNKEEK